MNNVNGFKLHIKATDTRRKKGNELCSINYDYITINERWGFPTIDALRSHKIEHCHSQFAYNTILHLIFKHIQYCIISKMIVTVTFNK